MPEYAVGERGQYAASPFAMPWRAWRQVLFRVKDRIPADNISIVSAGVAFYGFLALFPALAALVMIYGLIANPDDVRAQIGQFEGVIPPAVAEIVTRRLSEISVTNQAGLSIGLLLSLGFALWSATKGVKAMMTAMNIAYQQVDTRNIIWQNVFAVIFTFGGIVFFILSMVLVAVIPAAVAVLQPESLPVDLLLWSRWIVLAALVMIALSILYRYAPHRSAARLQWIAPGAVLAGILWLLISIGFSFYVRNFGNYDETFGPLSAVVVLLMWFYLSAFVVCVGAELNSELELQTYRDSTTGPPRRAGLRGAYVADTTREAPQHGKKGEPAMYNIFYIIGVVVVVLAILSFAGLA